jgi:hypothetical protein
LIQTCCEEHTTLISRHIYTYHTSAYSGLVFRWIFVVSGKYTHTASTCTFSLRTLRSRRTRRLIKHAITCKHPASTRFDNLETRVTGGMCARLTGLLHSHPPTTLRSSPVPLFYFILFCSQTAFVEYCIASTDSPRSATWIVSLDHCEGRATIIAALHDRRASMLLGHTPPINSRLDFAMCAFT